MSFMSEERAYEVYDALADANFDVSLTFKRYSSDSRSRNGMIDRGSYKIEVSGLRLTSNNAPFKRLTQVCEFLNMDWEATDNRTVSIAPKSEEWLPEYRILKEKKKRAKGFCAVCEQEVRKQVTSPVCEDCLAEERFRIRFGNL